MAETDPEAAKQLEEVRAKEAESNRLKKERQEERMAKDSEYAKKVRQANDRYNKARLSIRLTEPYSEDRRAAARDYCKRLNTGNK